MCERGRKRGLAEAADDADAECRGPGSAPSSPKEAA